MEDTDPLPLSAIQHWAYCPRQCALIHVEQAFDDNVHTLRGNAVHERVDQPGAETTAGVRTERALPLWHDELGIAGKADAVEFDRSGTPYPVEYKRGSRHKAPDIAHCDDLQLTAQALCLEAMTCHAVPEGAVFYAASKRRRVVAITSELRAEVVDISLAIRSALAAGRVPSALRGNRAAQRCPACSMNDRCQPDAADSPELAAQRAHLFDPQS